ncbi:unnamed protein product [Arabis nemorensis]|uniref:GCK domain-containing protein n=1 Tax=Arabis nemorensis TaxID=586526 RepID=A0A565AQF5_9BRAS|nr:unnamed protein product [Arabis nemorensis]
MGIASSSSSRNDQVRPEKVVDPTADWPDFAKDLVREMERECNAIAGSKEGDTEEEADARFREFMRRGGCKEAYKAFEDCLEETGNVPKKCRERFTLLFKCM